MATTTASKDNIDARQLLKALRQMARGDFDVRLPMEDTGLAGEIAAAFNNVVELNSNLRGELERIGDVVGKQGKIGQKASLGEASGGWQDCINSVNTLVGDLTRPTTDFAKVIGSVAKAICLRLWLSKLKAFRSRVSFCVQQKLSTRWSSSSVHLRQK